MTSVPSNSASYAQKVGSLEAQLTASREDHFLLTEEWRNKRSEFLEDISSFHYECDLSQASNKPKPGEIDELRKVMGALAKVPIDNYLIEAEVRIIPRQPNLSPQVGAPVVSPIVATPRTPEAPIVTEKKDVVTNVLRVSVDSAKVLEAKEKPRPQPVLHVQAIDGDDDEIEEEAPLKPQKPVKHGNPLAGMSQNVPLAKKPAAEANK